MGADRLYYGDNLEVMRLHLPDGCADLVYLDPPFNSSRDYNVYFSEQRAEDGEADAIKSASQIKAFKDTWTWDMVAAKSYHETVERGGPVSEVLQGFNKFAGRGDMLAYLSMMAPRLIELRRVMKPEASIYLHCDPTASHYLKLLMDAVFGPGSFLNEIIWKRTSAHSSARRYGPVHDTLLFYAKGGRHQWHSPKVAHNAEYVKGFFRHVDKDGRRYTAGDLTGAGTRKGESGGVWRGINPTTMGRHWALPNKVLTALGVASGSIRERLDELDQRGLIHWPEKKGGMPRLKRYADELEGAALGDVWTDIPPISAHSKERLGYPTQKPLALLERIIEASSSPGDLVLDPFCGCGTTVHAAQQLGRRWMGIDISHFAISLIKERLGSAFSGPSNYNVVGEPVSLEDARQLAQQDPFQFQWWVLGRLGARPVEQKKGADRGIDGRLLFHDDNSGETKHVVISVKSGKSKVSELRDLRGVVEREKAQIGVLVSLEPPTGPMRKEAADAGFYTSPGWNRDYPRLQILTVGEILDAGLGIDMPPRGQVSTTFKKAEKTGPKRGQSKALF